MKRPNTDLVGVAWLKMVPGIPADSVATRLPTVSGSVDVSKLRAGGFVRWRSGLGGTPAGLMRRPVGVAECWAAPAAGSNQVPWGRAADLAEAIMAVVTDEYTLLDHVQVQPPGDYAPAIVHTVRALSGDPMKVEDDPSGFARFDVDLEINWTGVPA